MNDKHTQEPWSVDDNAIYGNDGYYVGGAEYGCNEHIDYDENGLSINRGGEVASENAKRIVACVNACAGIPNEVLMTVAAFGGFGRDHMVQHLTKQRDELLACLNLIYSWANNWDSEFMNDPDWKNTDYPRIQATIAKLKGQNNDNNK